MAYSFFGIALVLLFVVGFAASAGDSFTLTILGAGESVSNPVSGESGTSHTVSVEVNYTGSENVNVTWSGGSGDIAHPTQTTISPGLATVTADLTIPSTGSYKQLIATYFNMSNASQELGSETANINFNITTPQNNDTGTNDTNDTDEFDFCNYDRTTKTGFEVGSDLEIEKVKDGREDNEDEWKWRPLDIVEIQVTVENRGTEDEDYVIEIAFFDDDGNEQDIAEDDGDLEEDVSIDEGEDEKVTFRFEVDGDVDEGDYNMHVKVYQDGDEDEQCASQGPEDNEDVEEIDIKKSKNDVIVKEVIGSDSAKAGSTITLEAKIANVGRDDEDRVKIIAFSNELGIKIEKEIEDLEEGETKTVTFVINLPSDIEEKEYKISFGTEFEYDEDDEPYPYGEESDEDDDIKYRLTVLGGVTNVAPRISAELQSDAVVGQELILSVLVTNNGNEENFIISTAGADSWANILSVNPTSINLGEAETQEILITLTPFEGGYQNFKVVTVYGGETYEQQITINIDELEVSEGFFSGSMFAENTSAYLIIGITALIILILLVLIAKMSRRKSGATF